MCPWILFACLRAPMFWDYIIEFLYPFYVFILFSMFCVSDIIGLAYFSVSVSLFPFYHFLYFDAYSFLCQNYPFRRIGRPVGEGHLPFCQLDLSQT